MVVQMRKPQISLLDGLNAPNRNRPLPISPVYTRTYACILLGEQKSEEQKFEKFCIKVLQIGNTSCIIH